MENKEFFVLDMLSLIYEDMDIDAIEERFVNSVAEIFAFDRVGLFFVKHRKGVLQGKLCRGFDPGAISSLEIPVSEEYLFTRPLVTGFPLWNTNCETDPFARQMGLSNCAIIPIVNKKRISCWQIKKCGETGCPAYGNTWLRCWLVPDIKKCSRTGRAGLDTLKQCESCEVFSSQDTNAIEGILLVDNSLSEKSIDRETITVLSVIAHAVGVAINNTKVYSSVLWDAIHDDLTGLHNRRYFNERLVDEVDRAKRYGGTISLLLADIDHFKQVNDTYGHSVGDVVLVWLGNLLRKRLRKTDLVARFGGEEFAIVLPNTDKERSFMIAENLRRFVADAILPDIEGVKVTISIGVASFGVDAGSFQGLLGKVDKALYQAKSLGRNRVCRA
jgi:diguanylate cyclase (GGDEF)-like protein